MEWWIIAALAAAFAAAVLLGGTTMSEVLDYDKAIIESIRHIEDILVKFSLQNYAATGAVFLAYFTHQMPLRFAGPVVVVLAIVFTAAIWTNIVRYKVFWKVHQIARDRWLADQPLLMADLKQDADCNKYLERTTLPAHAYLPVIIISLSPAAGAVAATDGRRAPSQRGASRARPRGVASRSRADHSRTVPACLQTRPAPALRMAAIAIGRSKHWPCHVRFTPKSGHCITPQRMSALCQKQTYAPQQSDRFIRSLCRRAQGMTRGSSSP